jgi:hypothetical protein
VLPFKQQLLSEMLKEQLVATAPLFSTFDVKIQMRRVQKFQVSVASGRTAVLANSIDVNGCSGYQL